jgi:hypothetical protein
LVLLFAYFTIYVASNASTSFDPPESPARHVMMFAIALYSLAAFPRAALRSLLIFSPLIAIYGFAGLTAYAAMAVVFALALPPISRAFRSILLQRQPHAIALLVVIALLPAVSAGLQGSIESLWSDQYGRGRLLMGYWHPKEAAASLALPLVLYLLHQRDRIGRLALLTLPALLWVVGSRNVALTVYLFIGLWRFPRLTASLLAVFALAAVAFLLVPNSLYQLIDEVSSLRLSVWLDALSDPSAVGGDDLLLGSRLAIDSFYVEILVSAGLAGLAAFGVWAALFYGLLNSKRPRAIWPKAFFVAILFFSAFDSGIVSTGNVMHITFWALAATPLIRVGARGEGFRYLAGRHLHPMPQRPASPDVASTHG